MRGPEPVSEKIFNFCWLSDSKISPNSVATPAIKKDEALIGEQNKQTKTTEPKIKGHKYAKN